MPIWDLFIDGSARRPKIASARLAAWAVVLAGPFPVNEGFPMASGYVQGRWQTVVRAEMTAMISARGVVARTNRACRIWVDNQLVLKRARAMQTGEWMPNRMSIDHDLWEDVANLLAIVGSRVQICKVASHQDMTDADDWEERAFLRNEQADACAKATFATYLPDLVACSDAVAHEWQCLADVKMKWHEYLVQVAKLSISQPETIYNRLLLPALSRTTCLQLIWRRWHELHSMMRRRTSVFLTG